MQDISFELRGDHITLDRLLKATGLATSGANAKGLIAEGQVQVDGAPETRKTAKLRAGQVVSFQQARVTLLPPDLAPPESGAAAPDEAG
jgi:ribosome-associated protein